MMALAYVRYFARVLRTQEQIDSHELGKSTQILKTYSDTEILETIIRPIGMMENCAGFILPYL